MENTILIFNSLSDPAAIAKQANKIRLNNKNLWYQIQFENETTKEKTRLKIFNTWIQLTTKPIFNTAMDQTPGEFKANIKNGLINLISNY